MRLRFRLLGVDLDLIDRSDLTSHVVPRISFANVGSPRTGETMPITTELEVVVPVLVRSQLRIVIVRVSDDGCTVRPSPDNLGFQLLRPLTGWRCSLYTGMHLRD